MPLMAGVGWTRVAAGRPRGRALQLQLSAQLILCGAACAVMLPPSTEAAVAIIPVMSLASEWRAIGYELWGLLVIFASTCLGVFVSAVGVVRKSSVAWAAGLSFYISGIIVTVSVLVLNTEYLRSCLTSLFFFSIFAALHVSPASRQEFFSEGEISRENRLQAAVITVILTAGWLWAVSSISSIGDKIRCASQQNAAADVHCARDG